MGVQYMQSEGLYSQLLQVGNLLHIGQHEAGHINWKQHGGDHGYFKTLLEGEAHDDHHAEEASSYIHVHAAEDTKPLILRSLEISNSGAHLHLPPNAAVGQYVHKSPPIHAHTTITSSSPSHITTASPHAAKPIIPSPLCLDPKPSPSCITSPLKRTRETCQIEGISKREKKGSEEGMKEIKGKKGVQAAAAAAAAAAALGGGRKAGGAKTKTSKPAPTEPPKTDYVHVRARRGQATDSHSLAERVRREKISERMRFLQDLVPSCSKITGKALILDEIINYVQSLQNQVEFLAMRLAAINPKLEYASLSNSNEEEIASPFVEEVRDRIDILPKDMATHTPTSDLHFDSLSAFYPGLFDDSNFNPSIVSDLSTSTCNDSNLTNIDFSHLG